MPGTTRIFIKTGMIFFMISLLIGVVTEVKPELNSILTPLFWHTLMVGWITQIIFGVSLWMFPGRSKTEDYRSQFLSWLIYGTLNSGLTLRIIFEPFTASDTLIIKAGLISSAVLQVSAAFGYFIEMWPRVISKEKRSEIRKMKRKDT